MRNAILEKKRSFFVVVGDHSKEAIVYREAPPIDIILSARG